MPTATFVQDGNTVDYTPSSAVAGGDVIVQNALVGVVPFPIAANELGSIAVVGVYDFPKAVGSGTAIPAGVEVNWDAGHPGRVDVRAVAIHRADGAGDRRPTRRCRGRAVGRRLDVIPASAKA